MRCAARLVIAFAVTASLLAAALVATALIPRAAIEPQVRASAEYLCKDEQFAEVIDGVASSKIDHYADAILLGIALQYDANAPVHSVMSSSYYHRDGRDESENLLQAATEGLPANREYLRYWHGSIVLVRPLLTLLSIRDIYRLNAGVMAALFVTLLMRLWRRAKAAYDAPSRAASPASFPTTPYSQGKRRPTLRQNASQRCCAALAAMTPLLLTWM